MKRRLTALLCAAVLLCSVLSVRAINVGDVYFTSVNDSLLPLSADTMPTWVGGALYVPASVFDSNVTGVDLGLYCSQSSTNNAVTLYTLRQMLVFDLGKGIAYDQNPAQPIAARAINRNGRIYLPVEAVCEFFGLEDSYNYTQHGYLVRIRGEKPTMDDARFMEKANTTMASRLEAFLRSQTPAVLPGKEEDDKPKPPPEQTDPQQPQVHTQVCLAFRCRTGEGLKQILDQLDRAGVRGMFFFAPDLLIEQDDLVRRVVGSGHSIGLLAEGASADASRRILNQGNETLRHVARTAATAALVDADQRQTLEEDGWVCWQETVDGLMRERERASTYVNRMIQTIGTRRRTVYLTLDDSSGTAGVLASLLQRMEQEEYSIITPLETRI